MSSSSPIIAWEGHKCGPLVMRPDSIHKRMTTRCSACGEEWPHPHGEELYHSFSCGFRAGIGEARKIISDEMRGIASELKNDPKLGKDPFSRMLQDILEHLACVAVAS